MGLGLLVGLLAGLVVFVGVPDWAVSLGGAGLGPTSTPAPAPVVGAPAPDFALSDLDGGEVRLTDLQGQVVLINFWATWCGPCRLEMPAIEAEYQARKAQGFAVLAVDLDESADDVRAEIEAPGVYVDAAWPGGGRKLVTVRPRDTIACKIAAWASAHLPKSTPV